MSQLECKIASFKGNALLRTSTKQGAAAAANGSAVFSHRSTIHEAAAGGGTALRYQYHTRTEHGALFLDLDLAEG